MKRFQAILRRWISMICCGALASAICAFAGNPFKSALKPVSDHLSEIRPDVFALAIIITTAVVIWPLARGRWHGFWGLRYFWSYPPLWVAIATSLLAIGIHSGIVSSWNSVLDALSAVWWLITEIPTWARLTIAGMAILAIMAKIWPKISAPKQVSIGSDQEDQFGWIRVDHEISHPRDDRFGHRFVSLRIVGRMTSSIGENPTIAVVGPLGSGKSTIRKLVEHYLKKHRSIQMLDISLWPLVSTEAAVIAILRSIIRALSKHVNTLAVTGLSEQYATTIERVSGRWGALAHHLRGDSRPEALLEGLATIATAAGIRLVVWIEDMERFTGADRPSSQETVPQDRERIGPILSLLYLLDRCDSISVIVCDTSLRSRLDVGKIARYVERPPRLTQSSVWQEIVELRSACFADQFIDPASDVHRKELTPPDFDNQLDRWSWNTRGTGSHIQDAMASVLDTPRSFKMALRITLETWEALRGEIDFDSVLVASTLKVSRPEMFTLIEENITLFRYGLPEADAGMSSSQKNHPVMDQVNSMLNSEVNEGHRNGVKAMITFVFPAFFKDQSSDDDYISNPQGLCVDRHTDYWQRYLTLPSVTERDSDQGALRAIHAWKQDKDNDMVPRMLDPMRSGQIESFVGQFSAEELCQLLEDSAAGSHNESAETWIDGEHAPGITSIWRMMHKCRPSKEHLGMKLSNIISSLIPIHLPLASDVFYFFAHDERSSVPSLIDQKQRVVIRETMWQSLIDSYKAGSGENVLHSLHGGSRWVLHYLLGYIFDSYDSELPSDGWSGIADALLEAAEQNPGVGLPLIIPLFTKSELSTLYRVVDGSDAKSPVRGYVATANLERAHELFEFDKLRSLLVNTPPPSDLDPQLMASYEEARVAAIENA